MFNVACKDPFEGEKVGERRARKFKESNDAIDSINDALSKTSMSARTTEVSGLFSSASSRSSRTLSTVESMSIRFDSVRHKHSSGTYDTSSEISRPASTKSRKRNRETSWRGAFAGSGTNPFAGHHDPATKHSSTTETWKHSVVPNVVPWASPQPSSSSTSPRDGDKANSRTSQARLSTPTDIPDPFVRFQRLLGRIEKASDHISATRLAERWPEDEEDENMAHEFEFETTLHALVRAQKLSAQDSSMGSAFPVPSKLNQYDLDQFAGANILHVGSMIGSPESWYLSTKYSHSIVHSLGVQNLPFDLSSSSWGLPPNLYLEEWPDLPRLDYVDGIFDIVVIAYHLFEKVKCTLWPILIDEMARVLVPNGLLIISTMDATPQHAGPMLSSWTHQNIILNGLRRFMVHQPSLLLPSWLDEDGRFENEMMERTKFPCTAALGLGPVPTNVGKQEVANGVRKRRKSFTSTLPMEKLARVSEEPERDLPAMAWQNPQDLAASWAGWNFYERLYASFMPPGSEGHRSQGDFFGPSIIRKWWIQDENILSECRRSQPSFEMTTFVYRRNQS